MTSIVIPRRFNGPPKSGNGGYVCGRLAHCLPGPVSVRLRRPPPLEHPLQVEVIDGEARLLDGEQLVATARTAELSLQPPATVTFAQAEFAARAYPGFLRHPLPTCFVCGPQRAAGDGLRIFAGPTADEAVWAAPWIPHSSLADAEGRIPPEFLWAALDCAGAAAVAPPGGEPILLGELCAALEGNVEVGERCVVVAWPLAVDGRKRYAGTAVLSLDGGVLARARATWIEVPSH